MKKYRVIKNPTQKEILLAQIDNDIEDTKSIPFLGVKYFTQQNEDLTWELDKLKDKYKKVAEIKN